MRRSRPAVAFRVRWRGCSAPTACAVAGTELTADLAQGLGRPRWSCSAATARVGPRSWSAATRGRPGSGSRTRSSRGSGTAGGDALIAGVEPTPASRSSPRPGRPAGVVISASHNPAADNGIKFFDRDGTEAAPTSSRTRSRPCWPGRTGPPTPGRRCRSARARAVPRASRRRRRGPRSDGLRVVVDCANGAASDLAPEVLRRLGATCTRSTPNPTAGTSTTDAAPCTRGRGRGGRAPGRRRRRGARRRRRPRAVRRRPGSVIDGDQVLAACAVAMHDAGDLPRRHGRRDGDGEPRLPPRDGRGGIHVVATRVGDRYVVEEMRGSAPCSAGSSPVT